MSQYRKILYVAEPTLASTPAYQRAVRLARASGAQLHLLVVEFRRLIDSLKLVRPDLMAVARHALMDEVRDRLHRLAGQLKHDGIRVTTDTVWQASQAAAIVERVREYQPDLVVKDVHHEPLIRRLLLRPVDWQLLRECPAPVMLVNAVSHPRPRRIVAAVDTMDESAAKLNDSIIGAALDLALQCDADLHLVHAYEGGGPFTAPGMEADPAVMAEGFEELRRLDESTFTAFADRHGVPAERRHLLLGPTVATLAEYASDAHADVLVLGTVHHAGLDRPLMGSTAERLVEAARCDLLALKPAAAPR